MLALTIDLQTILFETFEGLLASRIEGAIASGTYETGLETLRAESFTVTARETIYSHPGTGALTQLLTIERKDRVAPLSLEDAMGIVSGWGGELVVNARRSEEHTSELQSLMRISYAVFCLKKNNTTAADCYIDTIHTFD